MPASLTGGVLETGPRREVCKIVLYRDVLFTRAIILDNSTIDNISAFKLIKTVIERVERRGVYEQRCGFILLGLLVFKSSLHHLLRTLQVGDRGHVRGVSSGEIGD